MSANHIGEIDGVNSFACEEETCVLSYRSPDLIDLRPVRFRNTIHDFPMNVALSSL